MTWSIRDLAGSKFLWFDAPITGANGITTEGFLFVQDLSAIDPTLILPFLVGSLHLLNFELGSLLRRNNNRLGMMIFRLLSLGMFWATMHVPSVKIVLTRQLGFIGRLHVYFLACRTCTFTLDSKQQAQCWLGGNSQRKLGFATYFHTNNEEFRPIQSTINNTNSICSGICKYIGESNCLEVNH